MDIYDGRYGRNVLLCCILSPHMSAYKLGQFFPDLRQFFPATKIDEPLLMAAGIGKERGLGENEIMRREFWEGGDSLHACASRTWWHAAASVPRQGPVPNDRS